MGLRETTAAIRNIAASRKLAWRLLAGGGRRGLMRPTLPDLHGVIICEEI